MAYIGKSPSGSGVRTRYYFTQTSGGGTSISGTDDNGKTLTYTDGEYVDVYLNGVLLVHGTDYGTGTANTISSLAALASGDVVEVVVYDIFNVAKINNEAVRKRYYKTASGSETSISGADDSGATITFPANAEIEVKLNGVALVQGTDYNTTSANTVGGLSALSAGQVVEVVVYERFVLGDTVSKADGGAFLNAVSIDNINIDGNTISSTDTNGNITLDPDGTGDTIIASGNVGIGTGSPASIAHALHATSPKLTLERDSTSLANNNVIGEIAMAHKDSNDAGTAVRIIGRAEGTAGAAGLAFNTGTPTSISERLRIDSSGNLLVGKTAEGANNIGFQARPDGFFSGTRDGGTVSYLQRQTSDGEILRFQKDGSPVGSIGTNSGQLAIGSGPTGLKFDDSSDDIRPWNINSNNGRDNAIDLGDNGARFDDIFATNGTIQTSDQNEKQDIASLTTAEMTAAKAISKLFKTFKWQDKVAAKGDAARTHTGVIAQEVQTAMTDAGLDASNYAFWCSDTWWEADETYTDDDGVEQTRTNTYDTADEAPEGATQRTRLGIRYPELLAFIGAATEQRLADIEARLTALENAE